MAPSRRHSCLLRSCHARKNRHSTRVGGSARGTLNMGDMFGQPTDPIISVRWRFFSFCFDARQPQETALQQEKTGTPLEGSVPVAHRHQRRRDGGIDRRFSRSGLLQVARTARAAVSTATRARSGTPRAAAGPQGAQHQQDGTQAHDLALQVALHGFPPGNGKNQPTIFSGRTHSSNCASVTKPSARADAFSVVPSLCAFLAICAALS